MTSPFKYLTYNMVSVRVWRACVRAFAVAIKPGVLRASLMYVFGGAYGLPYKIVTFIANRGDSIRSIGSHLLSVLFCQPLFNAWYKVCFLVITKTCRVITKSIPCLENKINVLNNNTCTCTLKLLAVAKLRYTRLKKRGSFKTQFASSQLLKAVLLVSHPIV